uniref:Uncharacterized protein n=1 Tax=Erythrolobus australicus TaxID=1077150 RepID=A0A7S1XIH9_9RHOD|mmetsp:Transcript_2380/g.6439  ORF Transcript_2380/g.6439 Transcript_2380/m.6439 type:complete len:306 (+) Transcript_2380:35-952(+)
MISVLRRIPRGFCVRAARAVRGPGAFPEAPCATSNGVVLNVAHGNSTRGFAWTAPLRDADRRRDAVAIRLNTTLPSLASLFRALSSQRKGGNNKNGHIRGGGSNSSSNNSNNKGGFRRGKGKVSTVHFAMETGEYYEPVRTATFKVSDMETLCKKVSVEVGDPNVSAKDLVVFHIKTQTWEAFESFSDLKKLRKIVLKPKKEVDLAKVEDKNFLMEKIIVQLSNAVAKSDLSVNRNDPTAFKGADGKSQPIREWVLDQALDNVELQSALLSEAGALAHVCECLSFPFLYKKESKTYAIAANDEQK